MTKTITTYASFILAFILMAATFLTAKTYVQLTIAVILYPLLAYFALRLLPTDQAKPVIHTVATVPVKTYRPKQEKVEVTDIDKRTFIKLMGTAGVSFFIFSILGQRVGSWLFGNVGNNTISSSNSINNSAIPATNLNNFKISEIDDSGIIAYYGFVGPDGSWFIMRQDSNSNSFRYSRGQADFGGSWKIRENLRYDYYHKLF